MTLQQGAKGSLASDYAMIHSCVRSNIACIAQGRGLSLSPLLLPLPLISAEFSCTRRRAQFHVCRRIGKNAEHFFRVSGFAFWSQPQQNRNAGSTVRSFINKSSTYLDCRQQMIWSLFVLIICCKQVDEFNFLATDIDKHVLGNLEIIVN